MKPPLYIWTIHVTLTDPPFGLSANRGLTVIAATIDAAIQAAKLIAKGDIYNVVRGVAVDSMEAKCES